MKHLHLIVISAAIVAVAIAVLARNGATGFLPLALLAVCPLAMVLMMRGMHSSTLQHRTTMNTSATGNQTVAGWRLRPSRQALRPLLETGGPHRSADQRRYRHRRRTTDHNAK